MSSVDVLLVSKL